MLTITIIIFHVTAILQDTYIVYYAQGSSIHSCSIYHEELFVGLGSHLEFGILNIMEFYAALSKTLLFCLVKTTIHKIYLLKVKTLIWLCEWAERSASFAFCTDSKTIMVFMVNVLKMFNITASDKMAAGLSGSVGCASDWWSGGCGFNPRQVSNILSWRFDHEISLPSTDSRRAVVIF